MSTAVLPETILEFWFGHADPTQPATHPPSRWWTSDAALDQEIADRFGDAMEIARAGGLRGWLASPASALAHVIICDQFPRNVHRGTGRAFTWDPLARATARHIEAQGWSTDWALDPACFALLPFEHSERLEDQEHCVQAFTRLAARQPPALRANADLLLDYAVRHHAIVAQFGRFPHRNAALGRTPTPEETTWLASGGETFGQG